MNTLKKELRKNGFTYKLIERTAHAAMYRAFLKDEPHSFEVFKIKIRPEGIVEGVKTPETEIFPSNESFGKFAWSFGGKNAEKNAKECYEKLKDGNEEKTNRVKIDFGNYKIIKYIKNNNIMVVENNKLINKPKPILIDYIQNVLKEELPEKKTIKEMGEIIFR